MGMRKDGLGRIGAGEQRRRGAQEKEIGDTGIRDVGMK
jgi:hypothetical protein